ncbi:MAG: flagellar basal body rod protein FlgB [Bacteriovoracaceae bacterium]|jgi:flagellar basal-body rod protein FlgB|nr:flagellar basal body rod protein FlgB [Halobacteriovoraceae bacterium]MDP7320748.1 flagellar basal body rod protein FlgB [Bacteriovoracaceae bacterium]|tara:strand:- start:337 stop:744 length:408 start_codon:yes stop_codon:yes gene_type:complete
MNVNDKTLQALAAATKFREMRQEIISSNIANKDVPGYKSKRIDFEKALARALDVDGQMGMNTDGPRHYDVGSGGFNNLQPEVYEDPNGVVSEDGNTVDVQEEMALMAENKVMYDALVQLMNKKLGLMKYTINSER